MTEPLPPRRPTDATSRRRFVQLTLTGAGALLLPGAALGRLRATATPAASEAFLAAASAGDLATVTRLLGATPDLLRATDPEGRTAFALAHLHGHRAVGAFLASHGYLADAHEAALALDWERFNALVGEDIAIVNRDHPIGGSAMTSAALGGAGADMWRVYAVTGDPNAMPGGVEGVSPLQAALRFRDLPTAEMTAATLVGNAADPNRYGMGDAPPLHIAAERGSTELTEMLVRRGADVEARDGRGRTALAAAAAAGQKPTAALLERHETIARTCTTSRTAYDANGNPYRPPAIDAIPLTERRNFVGRSHGDLDYVRSAAAAEPRLVHSVATTGEISVEACAHTGRHEVVDFLLEHGAVYSLPTAVMRGDTERVKELLAEDSRRIHERGAHDFALLWYPAIGRCDLSMTELLLERGAKVEEQHYLGTTALHWAASRGPIELVELLIDHGADVNRRGRKFSAAGETPLERAVARDQPEIAKLLRERGAKS